MNKFKTVLAVGIASIMYCSTAFADMYNFSKSEYHAKERVTIQTTQKIYHKNNIWYLHIKTKHIDHNGRKSRTNSYYSCWNGNGTPYTNLSQSWMTTDKDLTGCPNDLPSK